MGVAGAIGLSDFDFKLYHWPGACSQVSVCALEMASLPYRLELVDLAAGQQNSSDYLAISPLGKVPYAVINGVGLSENSAIIIYLATLRPDAGILPKNEGALGLAEAISGLSFVGSTLQPIVRGILNPHRLTTANSEGVREKSRMLAAKAFAHAEGRLAERGWWLGQISIVDVYVQWALTIAEAGGFDFVSFPHLVSLAERLKQLPAYTRMLEINEELGAGQRT
jgi:glutathione S-transferase